MGFGSVIVFILSSHSNAANSSALNAVSLSQSQFTELALLGTHT